MTKFYNTKSETINRKLLRNNMPNAEVLLWSKLRGKQLQDCKFRRQYSIGKFVVDFYAPEVKLAIEVDGNSHFEVGAEVRDKIRQDFIESFGIRFLRFNNNDIYLNLEGVLDAIGAVILEIGRGKTSPLSPP